MHDNDSETVMETPLMYHLPTARCSLLVSLILAVLAGSVPAADNAKQKSRDAAFIKALSGTTLTGFFTIVGAKNDAAPKSDSYQISKVTKGGNFFLFHAKFGKANLPPLPLRVVWAGNKPVITMDKVVIPAMGTFSVHLLIDGDRYAGTWSHGKTVGHMWGMIKKTATKAGAKK